MKKIEDYIHLYIGCDVQWTRSDGAKLIYKMTLSDAGWLIRRYDVKLLLRPLSSMTEDEAIELCKFDVSKKRHDNIDIHEIQDTHIWYTDGGFTQSSCHDSRNIFDRVPLYENNGVAIMLSDSEFWYVTRQYDGGSSDPFERVLEVKSVHQVQNLYYALTGEELTIQE